MKFALNKRHMVIGSIVVMVLTACHSTQPQLTKREQQAVEKLNWIDTTDAEKELSKSLQIKDYRLYSKGTRGGGLIGISSEQQQLALQKCGKKKTPGLTDVRYGKIHTQYVRKVREFATKFNLEMLRYCLNNKS
ncbi:hypothetical protein [Aliikangiella coralliicola]|uniref:Lipoprotein n=1 Tax=Aliikangiella coralliicola TaxID=2592383 RepID=A0A545UCS8_9GAMM|nr:hypothetical protein [Aliikangiella coralliicola]TQV87274.1 hypothetical protein FLL46_12540 [Aliikangiella coralliicola]